MKGSIYTDAKCPVCGGAFRYDANRAGMFCESGHKAIPHYGKCRVHFVKTKKRFDTVQAAEQFLNYLRFKYSDPVDGYDPRDYQRDNPLSFRRMAEKWVDQKSRESIKPSTLSNLKRAISRAKDHFSDINVKQISDGDIEDFLYAEHKNSRTGKPISDKTRSELRSALHQFFSWVCRREKIPMPTMPVIKFELGWRRIVDMDTQQKIISEVWRISGHINPRIWLGISVLSHNSNVRPGELIKVAEGDVLLDYAAIMVRYPKEGSLAQGKAAKLWDEEIAVIKSLPKALPDVPLFRHTAGQSGIVAGEQFSNRVFNRWWKRACKNLGVEGVTLYPGTKHSTMTAVSKMLTPEQIRKGGSRHASRAMERYLIPSDHEANLYQETVKRLRGGKAEVVPIKKKGNE
jgi:integrase